MTVKHYIVLLEVENPKNEYYDILMDFKRKMSARGNITVVETIQDNFDFLYNSLIEKANNEEKRRS